MGIVKLLCPLDMIRKACGALRKGVRNLVPDCLVPDTCRQAFDVLNGPAAGRPAAWTAARRQRACLLRAAAAVPRLKGLRLRDGGYALRSGRKSRETARMASRAPAMARGLRTSP